MRGEGGFGGEEEGGEEGEGRRLRKEEVDVYALGLQEVVDVNNTQNFWRYPDPKVEIGWREKVQVS